MTTFLLAVGALLAVNGALVALLWAGRRHRQPDVWHPDFVLWEREMEDA